MHTHLDRDALVNVPPDEPLTPVPDDTALHDIGDLWRDVGGCG